MHVAHPELSANGMFGVPLTPAESRVGQRRHRIGDHRGEHLDLRRHVGEPVALTGSPTVELHTSNQRALTGKTSISRITFRNNVFKLSIKGRRQPAVTPQQLDRRHHKDSRAEGRRTAVVQNPRRRMNPLTYI
jgi:hypothetical protein